MRVEAQVETNLKTVMIINKYYNTNDHQDGHNKSKWLLNKSILHHCLNSKLRQFVNSTGHAKRVDI